MSTSLKGITMVDILHKVGIAGSTLADVYAALATPAGVATWWTETVEGESVVGGRLAFLFDRGRFDARIVELVSDRRVVWEITGGEPEWIGTTITFDLRQDGDFVTVLFTHAGWREPVEFMHHCSTKWGVFMLSLKSVIETGAGHPAPHDVKIDSWN